MIRSFREGVWKAITHAVARYEYDGSGARGPQSVHCRQGRLEGATTGQVVSAEMNNGCIDNKANCVFVGGAIGVGACQGGDVIWVPGVYGTCLRVSDVDYEPSFRRMPQT